MSTEKKHIFDNPKNVRRVLYGLFGSLVLLLAIEPFIRLCSAGAGCKIYTQTTCEEGRGLL